MSDMFLSPVGTVPQTNASNVADVSRETLEQAAKDFETAFIAQMLQFSGLTEALTRNGGQDMEAFASLYIESLAEDISARGGFGLAEDFYKKLQDKQDMTHVEHSNL